MKKTDYKKLNVFLFIVISLAFIVVFVIYCGFFRKDPNIGIEAAVEMIKNKGASHYDLVLMDIQMPFMNGYETTTEIRKIKGTKQLPIIALSANAFEEDRQKAIESGMNEHVAKPINIKQLAEVLGRFLNN